MLSFFKRLFSALEDNAALRKENEILKAQRDASDADKTEWKQRFLHEVAANRRREDAMSEIIRQLAKVPGRVPEHAPEEQEAKAESEQDEPPTQTVIDEEGVMYIADQFRAQDPDAYKDADDFEALCKKIRENPDRYM
jgi:hypothetical protein